MDPVRYVGLTGCTHAQDLEYLLCAIPEPLVAGRYWFMAGILASTKTLKGVLTRYPFRYPPIERLAAIPISDPAVVHLVHYHCERQENLKEELWRLKGLMGEQYQGLQLNMAWPDLETVLDFYTTWTERWSKREPIIVLQVGESALAMAGERPDVVAREVAHYWKAGCITHVLIDASGGRKKQLDPIKSAHYLRAIQEMCPGLQLVVAGGLAAPTLSLLTPLIHEFPGLSIDAEGGVRDNDDRLQFADAAEYLVDALQLLQPEL